MNTVWLLKGIPDFENIAPVIFRFSRSAPEAKFLIVLDSGDAVKGRFLITYLERLKEIIQFDIFNLHSASDNELDEFLKVNAIKTIIFEWGNGYPTSLLVHLKWFFSNKKSSLRSRLIRAGRKNQSKLVCLPHAVSMHKSVLIKPRSLLRRVSNFLTDSELVEDYSDRNIFDALLFYNKIQCSNYKHFYNLAKGQLGLMSLYKYDREWIEVFYKERDLADQNIVLSIPKLRNYINIDLLLQTLSFLEEYCQMASKTVICAFHPRVEISLLPEPLLDLIKHSCFEICTQPFSQIVHRANILLDAGSSILLDGLAYRLPVGYLSYLDENEIVEILDDNFYEVNSIGELGNILEMKDSGNQFTLPAAFAAGDRYSAEQIIEG